MTNAAFTIPDPSPGHEIHVAVTPKFGRQIQSDQ